MDELGKWKPVKKVAYAGVAGALATLVVFLLESRGVAITDDVSAALATLIGFGITIFTAYMTPDKKEG